MSTVGVDLQSLPDDPEALRALLVATMARCGELTEERDALAVRNERLRHLLGKLQRMRFERRSERLPEDQLQFAFEEVEASLAGNEAEAEKGSPELRKTNTARRRQAAAACRRTCRASSGCSCPRAPPARAARDRWWRSGPTPRSSWR